MSIYHRKLQISEDASLSEIKQAYRQLAKKYHPDVSNMADADKKFIEITEAYEALLKYESEPELPEDPLEAELKEMRRKAHFYAWQKRQAEEKQKQASYDKIYGWVNYVNLLFLLINIFLIVDYFLPPKVVKEKILGFELVLEAPEDATEFYFRQNRLITENYQILIKKYQGRMIRADSAAIFASPFLNNVLKFKYENILNNTIQVKPSYGLYRKFGFLIPALIICSLVYYFMDNRNPNKLNFFIINCFIIGMQTILYFVTT